MKFFLNGKLTIDGASEENLWALLSKTTGTGKNCHVTGNEVEFTDHESKACFDFLFPAVRDAGYTVNGDLSFYGDDEGRFVVQNNEIQYLNPDEFCLRDVDSSILIQELTRRGFAVTSTAES